jgi:hypothetical protein
MKTWRMLYHLARADFLERTRRFGFLAALAVGVFFGYAVNTGDIVLELDNYRGVYNSAWLGSMMTLVITTLFTLAGFYLVKGAVERDYATGVGQIMATTPLTRPLYTLGKWLSNFALLAVLVLVMAGAAVIMQLTQREVPEFDLVALLMPFVVVALPAMALVAAAAVFFETISWLRGGLGNVIYFFVWTTGLPLAILPLLTTGAAWPDPIGLGLFYPSMAAAVLEVYPGYQGGFNLGGADAATLNTFAWSGVNWTPAVVLSQMIWLAAAVLLVLAAAGIFTRFDPARAAPRRVRHPRAEGSEESVIAPATAGRTAARSAPSLSPVTTSAFRFPAVWLAEMRLLLQGARWWWYAGALVMIVGGFAAPPEAARQSWLPFAWVWPMLHWSQLGNREARHRMDQIVFAAPHALLRQLPAAWLAGVALAALTGSGVLARLLLAGDLTGLAAALAGSVFVPALALAMGVWTSGSKLFEISYLLLWYLGPLNAAPYLDYVGALGPGHPGLYLALTAGLLLLAAIGRARQIHGHA